MKGWIKLHRSLKHWEWYDDINATRLLIHLLISVNYEPKRWKGQIIAAGDLVTSWDNLSKETGLTVKQLRVAMDKLERSGEVVRKRAVKWQTVTLVKWDKLQGSVEDEGNERAAKGQPEGNERATTKESKEEEDNKEFKEKNKFNFRAELLNLDAEEELVSDWLKVRAKKKAANTKTALKGFTRELEKSGLQINEVLTICIERNWQGFRAEWITKTDTNGTETDEQYAERIAREIAEERD